MEYSINLFKISDCENPVFANNIEPGFEKNGMTRELPEVNKRFLMSTEEIGGFFITSRVTEIVKKESDNIMFKTLNSFYYIRYEEIIRKTIDVKKDKNSKG